jgi:hypothetical protein
MARPDCLTIHTNDLQQIMDLLLSLRAGAGYVKLVDDGKHIQVRDTGDFRIGTINKSETTSNNKNSTHNEKRLLK